MIRPKEDVVIPFWVWLLCLAALISLAIEISS